MLSRTGLVVATALAAAVVGVPVTPPAAEAAGPRCDGRRATIVGTAAADRLFGTPGDDVIVSRGGADLVFADAGDDVVCTGPGDDDVHTGTGDDVLLARGGDDNVTSAGGVDRIVLGPGDDQVLETVAPDGISIRGRGGDDEVQVRTSPGAEIALLGGAGLNMLYLRVDDAAGRSPVDFDRAGATMSVDGPQGAFGGWSVLALWGEHDWSYLGTDAPDEVVVFDGRFVAHLRGGTDNVTAAGGEADFVDGGAGIDGANVGDEEGDTCVDVEAGDCGTWGDERTEQSGAESAPGGDHLGVDPGLERGALASYP